MRNCLIWLMAAMCMSSCAQGTKEASIENSSTPNVATQDFFPVTNFIEGEIVDIRNNGVNPLRITTRGQRVDSSWVKVEELNQVFADFLQPLIDSSTMWPYFKETKFLDQTINAYTFTYEPRQVLPDSIDIQRWDVYIDPQANRVKKIYIEKVNDKNMQLRLTWQSKEWCRIITFSDNDSIENEVLIKWRFE